jgi:hypothetical protein
MKPHHKMLYFEAAADLHQQIATMAKQSGRTISREIQRRLWATFKNPNWEHLLDCKQALIAEGWIEHYDPRYGGNVLLPPGTVTEALSKITGSLAASEAPDSASIQAQVQAQQPGQKVANFHHSRETARAKTTAIAPDRAGRTATPEKERETKRQSRKTA